MAQKRKANQSKLDDSLELLKKLEEKTARAVKPRLNDSWRDNLFEIIMTRIDLAAPQKKTYAAIPGQVRLEPKRIPSFAKLFLKTMRNMLKLAGAPASPLHVAALGVLYASVIDTFLKDDTKDRSKTMAALDKRLEMYEQVTSYIACKK